MQRSLSSHAWVFLFVLWGRAFFLLGLMPHHRQVPDPGHSGHALRNEEPKGVRTTSFRDFLQNGYTWPRLRAGESSGVGQAGGHPSGVASRPREGSAPTLSRTGQNYGLQGKASAAGPSKREQISILGVGRLSTWSLFEKIG